MQRKYRVSNVIPDLTPDFELLGTLTKATLEELMHKAHFVYMVISLVICLQVCENVCDCHQDTDGGHLVMLQQWTNSGML